MSEDDSRVVLRRRSLEEQVEYLVLQVGLLTARLNKLENKRKGGRKPKPIQVQAVDVCGIDPNRDSSTCPDASLYYRRLGCAGVACMRESSEYWKNRKS